MHTATTNSTNDTPATDKQQAFVCACCVGLFPAIYLIGIAVKSILG
ncbi:MAG: hypothetical protein KDC54_07470 [Lewinella sp.]|nr:hypothetical protein [Lewinella sp.]